MKNIVKIVSDGIASGTHVFNHDGSEIHNIERIEIEPIVFGSFVKVRLTISVKLDMNAEVVDG